MNSNRIVFVEKSGYPVNTLLSFQTTLAIWIRLSLGGLLVGLVLLLNALTSSPQLHELLHADAGQAEHLCAVTLFAHGQVDAADAAVVACLPSVAIEFFPQPSVLVLSLAAETLPPGRAPPAASRNS